MYGYEIKINDFNQRSGKHCTEENKSNERSSGFVFTKYVSQFIGHFA